MHTPLVRAPLCGRRYHRHRLSCYFFFVVVVVVFFFVSSFFFLVCCFFFAFVVTSLASLEPT
jgi:hypothetical protein